MSTLAEIEAAADSLSQAEKEALLQFLVSRLGSGAEGAPGFPSVAAPHGKVSEWLRTAKGSVRTAAGETVLPLEALVGAGVIDYIDFPPALVGKYQCFTEADLGRLRGAGCKHDFVDVASGVAAYVAWLQAQA